MKKRIPIYNLLLLLSTAFLMSLSQADTKEQFKSEYKKLMQHYMKLSSYRADLSYSLYAGHTSVSPLHTTKGIIKKEGDNIYTSYFNFESLKSGPINLFADHKHRIISITEKDKKIVRNDRRGSLSAGETMQLIDSMIPHLTNLELKEEKNSLKRYSLSFPSPSYKSIDLVFDVKTLELHKLVLYCKNPVRLQAGQKPVAPRAEISFDSLNIHPAFTENDFSVSRFAIKQDGKYIPSSEYKDYKVYYSKLKK